VPIPQKNQLALTVVVSVLVHILLFALLYMNKQTTKIPLVESQPAPIVAQLYYYTPPVETEREDLVPVDTTEDFPEQPAPEQSAELVVAEPELNEEINEAELVEQVLEVEQSPPKVAPPPPQISATAPSSDSEEKNKYKQPLQDVVQGQLNNYRQGKLDNLAAQAAKEYRKQLSSPNLLSKPQDPFVTEEERFVQKITTSVDCSSATNQTLAIVMGIMGGAVKCSEPPPFDSFIQKRLNKTAELPALQQ
jgi:hypothetical protein